MKLSVVVNNYNYASYLAEAVERALVQLARDDELIVIDDGSTDQSHEVLSRYQDHSAVQVVKQSNQGQLEAMLNGMQEASGDLVLLLDSDDYYLDGYLERLRNLAREHPRVELFFSAPHVGGSPPHKVLAIKEMLRRMEIEPGPTGPSRWATLYTGEFLGSPTSGLALRSRLVERILNARDHYDDKLKIDERICRLLRLPRESHNVRRLSGDGIVVRAAGAVGALKYYDPRPAFYYRIHESNAFARIGSLGRFYLRLVRGQQIGRQLRTALPVRRPGVAEVIEEARGRSRPLRRKRCLRLALNYLYIAVRAQGGIRAKAKATVRIFRIFLGKR